MSCRGGFLLNVLIKVVQGLFDSEIHALQGAMPSGIVAEFVYE